MIIYQLIETHDSVFETCVDMMVPHAYGWTIFIPTVYMSVKNFIRITQRIWMLSWRSDLLNHNHQQISIKSITQNFMLALYINVNCLNDNMSIQNGGEWIRYHPVYIHPPLNSSSRKRNWPTPKLAKKSSLVAICNLLVVQSKSQILNSKILPT